VLALTTFARGASAHSFRLPRLLESFPDVTPDIAIVLWSVAYLMAKHFVADFALQSTFQVRTKGIYGHPGGLLHAGIHIVFTAPVFLLIRPSLVLGLAILAAEYVIHYHVDWSKEQILKRRGWTTADGGYWILLGIDQLLHGWTYVAIVAALVIGAS
jgi:hypothetical protein